jgi:hypothetical protein
VSLLSLLLSPPFWSSLGYEYTSPIMGRYVLVIQRVRCLMRRRVWSPLEGASLPGSSASSGSPILAGLHRFTLSTP